jgi:hypothetical protein
VHAGPLVGLVVSRSVGDQGRPSGRDNTPWAQAERETFARPVTKGRENQRCGSPQRVVGEADAAITS